jgi:hypothetical protein
MEIRPEIQIRAMIKAMVDVVLPAVDPEQMMAQEQARLVIGTLGLIANRLPLAYRFDRDQLNRYVALSREIVALDRANGEGGQAVSKLESLAERGADVLKRARAEPSELESTVFDLRAEVSSLLQSLHKSSSPEKWVKVNKLILDASKLEIERERALVVAMGFEPDPESIPPIESLLPRVNA